MSGWWIAFIVLFDLALVVGLSMLARKSPAPTKCARDSDWCDGRVCRERGIDCPNADVERHCRDCGNPYLVAPEHARSGSKWYSLCGHCLRWER